MDSKGVPQSKEMSTTEAHMTSRRSERVMVPCRMDGYAQVRQDARDSDAEGHQSAGEGLGDLEDPGLRRIVSRRGRSVRNETRNSVTSTRDS
jgi:hypothetical protein